jgi:hypothetical protein
VNRSVPFLPQREDREGNDGRGIVDDEVLAKRGLLIRSIRVSLLCWQIPWRNLPSCPWIKAPRNNYNFVRPHRALRFGAEVRTPAMQAGLTKRQLASREIFPRATFLWVSERVTFRTFDHLGHANETRMPQASYQQLMTEVPRPSPLPGCP